MLKIVNTTLFFEMIIFELERLYICCYVMFSLTFKLIDNTLGHLQEGSTDQVY